MVDIVCQRCGTCCWLKKDGFLFKPCKYLVKVGKRYVCRIYKNRLGKNIGYGFVCIERKKDKHNYEGCPLNVLNPNNPIITKRPKGENNG